MSEHGHVQRALVVARELTAAGACVYFFTGHQYLNDVRATGAIFRDLFHQRSLEVADSESIPIPCRYVTFAAHYADSLASELASLAVSLIIHDAFAVISIPVAQITGIPRITLCAGHHMPPASTVSQLAHDPRVRIAPCCYDAVDTLRRRYGFLRATPFSYFDSLSTQLNIISEPPEFLQAAETKPFEPCLFFGSLDRPFYERFRKLTRSHVLGDKLQVYCSFGTVAPRYYSMEMSYLAQSIIGAAHENSSIHFIISTGGRESFVSGNLPSNITVRSFVDQVDVLSRADIYLTHHGLNSTHESVYLLTPMLSYPLFADQPGLARRCQELEIAVPLTAELRGAVTPSDISNAIRRVTHEHERMQICLEQARDWEIDVVNARPTTVQRILEVA